MRLHLYNIYQDLILHLTESNQYLYKQPESAIDFTFDLVKSVRLHLYNIYQDFILHLTESNQYFWIQTACVGN